MRSVLLIATVLSGLTQTASASGYWVNTSDFRSDCRAQTRMRISNDPTEGVGTGLCVGILSATVDAIEAEGKKDVCLADSYRMDDLIDAVLAWMTLHPKEASRPSGVTVIREALHGVYPCP